MEMTFVRYRQPGAVNEDRMSRLLLQELAYVRRWADGIGLKYEIGLDVDPMLSTNYPTGTPTTTFSGPGNSSPDDNSVNQDDWSAD